MNKNKKTIQKRKGQHLTYGKRCKIETLLSEGQSMRYIAECIGCSPSTVSREIKQHSFIQKSHTNDCLNKSNCHKRNVCGGISCRKKCKTCNKCKKYCSDYTKAYCTELEEKGLCNSCHKRTYCHFDKKIYKADIAENEYREMLVGRRNGFDLTGEEIELVNSLVTPLIQKGQSPYHIKQTLCEQLPISESTLRRMINANELDVRAIDLREAVKRKPRTKRNTMRQELSSPSKAGRLYEDYLEYIAEHDVSIVEMDCVEGKQEDQCAILTLHFVAFHMQLYFIMPYHTSECVVATLDKIEEAIGTELFRELFPLILTDNGHEFWDMEGMERSITTGLRTRIFFCEPNRSDQKGACENNHKLFRCIVPKGTSIDGYMQSDMTLATNHINSYRRKSLFGMSPYEQAMQYLPEDFFILLGLEKISAENVLLKPTLLNSKNMSE